MPLVKIENSVYKNKKTTVYSILRGAITIRKEESDIKLYLLGLRIFYIKNRRWSITRVFGIPIFFYNREKKFYREFKREISRYRGEISDILIFRHNLGENCIYFSLFEDWIKFNNIKKPAIILWNEREKRLFSMFIPKNNKIRKIEINITQTDINSFFRAPVRDIGGIKLHSPTFRIAEEMKKIYIKNGNVNFVSFIKKSLNIPVTVKLKRPYISENAANAAKKLIAENNATFKKIIVICPESNSLSRVSLEFWEYLTKKFTDLGYFVFVNQIYEGKSKINAGASISPPVDVLYALIQRSQGYISIASGLGVLLTFTGVMGDLIYTPFTSKSIGYSSDMAMAIYSVKNMDISGMNINTNEYIYPMDNSYIDLADEILEKYK
jgi:hypothetical protein